MTADAYRPWRKKSPSPADNEPALEKLVSSINEVAQTARTLFTALLATAVTMASTILATTDLALLQESFEPSGALGIRISVVHLYAFAPPVFLFIHVNGLLQLYILHQRIVAFDAALDKRGLTSEQRASWYRLLHGFIFAQLSVLEDRAPFHRFLLRIMGWLTWVALPIALLVAMQVSFLRYQSEAITLTHQLCVVVDVLVVVWFVQRVHKNSPSIRNKVRRALSLVGNGVMAVVILMFSIFTARTVSDVPPNPMLDWINYLPSRGMPPALAGFHKYASQIALAPWKPQANALDGWCHSRNIGCRYLDLSNQVLVHPASRVPALREVGLSHEAQKEAAAQATGLFLRNRSLRHVNLNFAFLPGADLEGADLTGARLHRTNLNRARLVSARLERALLSLTVLDGASLHDIVLDRAEISGLNLTGFQIEDASLAGATVYSTNLAGSQLRRVILTGATLVEVDLRMSNLSRAVLQGAELRDVDLSGAVLENAELQLSSLIGGRLVGASLADAKMQGAIIRSPSIAGTSFRGANLRGTTIASPEADLVDLRGVILDPAWTDGEDRKIRETVLKHLPYRPPQRTTVAPSSAPDIPTDINLKAPRGILADADHWNIWVLSHAEYATEIVHRVYEQCDEGNSTRPELALFKQHLDSALRLAEMLAPIANRARIPFPTDLSRDLPLILVSAMAEEPVDGNCRTAVDLRHRARQILRLP